MVVAIRDGWPGGSDSFPCWCLACVGCWVNTDPSVCSHLRALRSLCPFGRRRVTVSLLNGSNHDGGGEDGHGASQKPVERICLVQVEYA